VRRVETTAFKTKTSTERSDRSWTLPQCGSYFSCRSYTSANMWNSPKIVVVGPRTLPPRPDQDKDSREVVLMRLNTTDSRTDHDRQPMCPQVVLWCVEATDFKTKPWQRQPRCPHVVLRRLETNSKTRRRRRPHEWHLEHRACSSSSWVPDNGSMSLCSTSRRLLVTTSRVTWHTTPRPRGRRRRSPTLGELVSKIN